MKKSILIMFMTAVCLAMMAPVVFAIDFTSSSSTVLGSVVFTPSTNVVVNATATDGSDSTNPNQYCVTSFHGSSVNQTSGKQYAALSGGGTGNVNTAIVAASLAGVSTPPRCTVVNAWPTGTWQ